MIFGNKKWFEELTNNVKFPSFFAYYLIEELGMPIDTRYIEVCSINTTAKSATKINYSLLMPTPDTTPSRKALIGVHEISSPAHYYHILELLCKNWSIQYVSEATELKSVPQVKQL